MDVSFLEKYNIAALVMLSQAGMEGGNALADVFLSGAVTPSGKLTDTLGLPLRGLSVQRDVQP